MGATPQGVLFPPDAYASLVRRVAAAAADVVVLVLLLMAILLGLYLFDLEGYRRSRAHVPPGERIVTRYDRMKQGQAVRLSLVTGIAYHVLMRRTRGGTVGYRLLGARIVNAQGESPTLRMLIRRTFLAIVGVLPFGATYFSCARSDRRQAWHDRWANTWVLRKGAQPAGSAEVVERARFLGTYMFAHQVLVPPPEESP